ncbi:hypothetical protein IF1G_04555 [Cordyceps javanica]|uniref:Uncharacterized protein n=1 Tax=Cordyceps javanica TaxID=43265 RepID=A0A545V6H2_9HYPO|nr:hypothetical protein IF1G_04555 [Cordyceps javanica]
MNVEILLRGISTWAEHPGHMICCTPCSSSSRHDQADIESKTGQLGTEAK